MEEKIIIKSKERSFLKNFFVFVIIGIMVAIIVAGLIIAYRVWDHKNGSFKYVKGGVRWHHVSGLICDEDRNMWECLDSFYHWQTPLRIFIIVTLASPLFGLLFGLLFGCMITVTDKRVYGTTWFGKSVDLPIENISSVGHNRFFGGISVGTSSGLISFLFIKNASKFRDEILKLILERQGKNKNQNQQQINSSTEELKTLKELLDSGIITQEEFEAKKKQILGL